MTLREPLAQVIDHAGKEPRLGDTESKTRDIELSRCPHREHRASQQPPRDRDARQPPPCTDACKDDVARNFEQRVAEEKNAGTEAECRVAEIQVRIHLQRGDADIDAIDIRNEIECEQERQKPCADLPHGGRLLVEIHCWSPQRLLVADSAWRREHAPRHVVRPASLSATTRTQTWKCLSGSMRPRSKLST
jgi:hypothetical protein